MYPFAEIGHAITKFPPDAPTVRAGGGVPPVVSMFNRQPAEMTPESTPRSSVIHSYHAPFGVVPLNTDSAVAKGAIGPGELN